MLNLVALGVLHSVSFDLIFVAHSRVQMSPVCWRRKRIHWDEGEATDPCLGFDCLSSFLAEIWLAFENDYLTVTWFLNVLLSKMQVT